MSDPAVVDAVLADGPDRERIAVDLASTLFVEAGAGSGKTTALVGRIVALLAAGGVELADIAAITFTDAAAAELRQKLYRTLRDSESDALRVKASEIDDATITTIHGFAQRLLAEHTIEAGLPLHFEVTDEITATVAFEERFARFLDDLYDDESAHVLIQALGEFDVRAFHLHAFAEEIDARLGYPDSSWGRRALAPSDVEAMVVAAADRVEARIASLGAVRSLCTNPDDKLLARVDELAIELERGRALADWTSRLAWLRALATSGSNLGSRESWRDVGAVRALLRDVDTERGESLAALGDVLVRELAERLQAATRTAAAARVTAGMINFDDLLVLARDLVRDHAGVRIAAVARFRFILVDEFQDTDPLQTEMLLALAERDGVAGTGRLFFVGDPKQSIYSFRGADVGLYAATRERIVGEQPTRLVTNFRSRPGIVSYVNDLFSKLFFDQSELIGSERAGDLVAAREPHRDPAVVLVGGPMERVAAKDRRSADASEIAETIALALAEQWPVLDGERIRPIRLGDVAILIPTRTSVGTIQSALDRSNIDFTIAETTLVYAADEVRELLGILRAVDETADERDVIRALRASCFACGDAELAAWHNAGGRWQVSSRPEGPAGHPVGAALATLAALSARRHTQRVDSTLLMLIDELQIRQGLAARRGRAESLRRLDFIVERARAFVGSTGGTIAQFLDFAEQEARGRARSRELVAASAEVDAVKIMTIHAAKGLEFPLVIVADLGANVLARTASVLRGGAGVELSLTAELRSSGFEQARQTQLQLERAERVRLAYVGMTRARDYLVVMLRHETARTSQPGLAEQIWAISSALSSWRAGVQSAAAVSPAPEEIAAGFDAEELEPTSAARSAHDLISWRQRRAELLERINRPRSVAPSSLGHGVAPFEPGEPEQWPAASIVRTELDAEDDEATPWRRARQASARGRAVHAVLQRANLQDATDLASLAEVAASDEGIASQAPVVAQLAEAALASPAIRQALLSPKMMRELPLRVGIGEGAIEGIVDLCYLEEDGLVLVDYKTDALGSAADLASAGARYHLQIGAYVLALERATSMAVRRAVLIFLAGERGALEYQVPDLPGAVEAAREVVAATFRAPLSTRS